MVLPLLLLLPACPPARPHRVSQGTRVRRSIEVFCFGCFLGGAVLGSLGGSMWGSERGRVIPNAALLDRGVGGGITRSLGDHKVSFINF